MCKEKTIRNRLSKSFLLPLTVVLFGCLVLTFAGCTSDTSFGTEATGLVTFKLSAPDTDGRSFMKSFILGAPVGLPADPELQGYLFNGWYEEDVYDAESKAYNFTQRETRKDFTLYAWWFTLDGKVPDWLTGEEPFTGTIIDGVNSKETWYAAVDVIKDGGDGQRYRVNLTGDFNLPALTNHTHTFGELKDIEVEIKGTGNTIGLESNGRLFWIGENQALVLNDVTLQGKADNTDSLVYIERGSLTMKGAAAVSGNTSPAAGVHIDRGTFTMQDNATVSGNTATSSDSGGGVFVRGTFIMRDNATVSGNTASSGGGGGVTVEGNFTMQDNATVSGNSARYWGGGVDVYNGTFIMRDNATISGNTAGGEGGGLFIDGYLRIAGGTIYGNNAGSNSNTAGTGAALYAIAGAEYGVFNGDNWVPTATLPAGAIDNTIKVTNGSLAP